MNDTFRIVKEFGETRLTDNLGFGTAQFINQAYLNIGGFTNITVQSSGAYGGDPSRLRPVVSPYYIDGQVWEGYRNNWVFEKDVSYKYKPIQISGVYISGIFNPTTGVAYPFNINYPLGQIIFDNPLPTNSVVQCEYSFKNISIVGTDMVWTQEFQSDSFRVDDPRFLQAGSGLWNALAQGRIQLPAIIVVPYANIKLQGIQLGGGNKRYQDVIFHIYAQHPYEKNSIADDLINQKDASYYLYNRDRVLESGFYPLDAYGFSNPSGLSYTQLVNDPNYQYRRCVVSNVLSNEFSRAGGIFYIQVRWIVEVYI